MGKIEKMFESYEPTEKVKSDMEFLKECVQKIAGLIDGYVPDCREKSLALTKLEECLMWVNKGITRN